MKAIMQNKANSAGEGMLLSDCGLKGYVRIGAGAGVAKQSQFRAGAGALGLERAASGGTMGQWG
jgi:hypothetical protein